MSTDPSTPANDANLSGLGRALLESKEGSKPSGPWVPPTAEELGKLLPEYEIVKMLGRGGMGAVYMGRQISLDRPVAIKILSNTLDEADASFAERFKNEARAMGKLNHPGIVAVHDFGQTGGGLLYIVMEYVGGTDVSRMIAKEGRLHTEHAMAITAHVCDALAYAHERGIIHRDIKPANIMVGYDGVVKVADFGLAKMTHSQNTGLTQSGMAMGTLHYMAPETLMLGSAVDHRADIYAVGVMLYQMLTGKIPQGMFKLPSLQIPGLDPRYDAIIAKGIMEDREARYQSIGEMRRDLDGILTQPVLKVEPEASQAPAALPTQARPQRPGGQPYRPPQPALHAPMPKSSSGWLVWAVLGVLALGGGYFWLTSQPSSSGTSSEMTATSPKPVPPNPFEAVDPPDQPMPPAPVASVQPAAAMPLPTVSVPTPAAPAFDLQQLPDFRIRIANYQKARHAKLSALAARYRAALIDAQSRAPADAAVYTSALTQAAALMTEIEKNLTATEVMPLSALAATTGSVPQRLKELRDIFEKETIKLETALATDLDQSLSVVQASLAQAGTLDAANAVAAYRQQLSAVTFIMAGSRQANGAPVALQIDLMSIADWSKVGGAIWGVVGGAFQSSALLDGYLTRVLPYDEYELTGEFMASATANGGVFFSLARAPVTGQSNSGYQLQLAGTASLGKSKTGSIGGNLVRDNRFADDTWIAFRIRLANGKIQAWLNGVPYADFRLPPESERPHSRMIALHQKGVGTVSYRNLRVTPVTPVAATVVPPLASSANNTLLQATKDKPFVNSLGMKFLTVKDTEVMFCIHETRYKDYAAYAAEIGNVGKIWKRQLVDGYSPTENKEEHPVTRVTWEDARAFCAWLSKKEGRTYRLPTDREWSCAVGVGRDEKWKQDTTPATIIKDTIEFPWGTKWPPPKGAGNYSDQSRKEKAPRDDAQYLDGYDDGFPTTAPVMSFAPNNLGLYDLGGNVWEWCEDRYNVAKADRVLRGGSWNSVNRDSLLSSSRNPRSPSIPNYIYNGTYGFRVVLELP